MSNRVSLTNIIQPFCYDPFLKQKNKSNFYFLSCMHNPTDFRNISKSIMPWNWYPIFSEASHAWLKLSRTKQDNRLFEVQTSSTFSSRLIMRYNTINYQMFNRAYIKFEEENNSAGDKKIKLCQLYFKHYMTFSKDCKFSTVWQFLYLSEKPLIIVDLELSTTKVV